VRRNIYVITGEKLRLTFRKMKEGQKTEIYIPDYMIQQPTFEPLGSATTVLVFMLLAKPVTEYCCN
jgi:hypothetical protein